ncbi:MAG: glycosyltransferase family 39 protein [Anaerolineales bacterium]
MLKSYAPQLRVAALIVGFLLTLAGILLLRQGSIAVGFIVIAIGIAGYLWSSFQLQKQSSEPDDFRGIRKYTTPAVFAFLGLASTFAVFYLMTDPRQNSVKEYAADILWIFSVLFLLVTVFWLEGVRWISRQRIRSWWAEHLGELLILGGIVLVAVLARTIDLADHPYPWSGDEASVRLEARRILDGEVTNFFDTGWSGQPNWSFVPTALSLRVFGDNIIGVRMVSALGGILAVVFVYLLGKEMFNKQVGWLAAGFLALYPIHVHFSRIGVNNINDSFVVVLVLWLAFRALRTGRFSDYALAGVASGLTIYTYVGTRLVLIIALGTLAYMAIFRRGFVRANIKALAWFLVAAVITALPMAYYFARHPDIFINRIGQEGILFNGWLVSHAQETGQSVFSVLMNQISRSTLVFIAHGAPGNFYNSPHPYLTVLGAVLLLLGMVYAFSKLRHSPNVILLGWFWSVVLLGGVLTLNPPSNTRMVMTAPAVALFVAIGLWQLGQVLERINISSARRTMVMFAIVLFLIIENGIFYFGEYRTNYYFQDPSGELAMEAGQHLRELGPDYSLLLLGYPRVFAGFPTLTFMAPENDKGDLSAEELENIVLPSNQGVLFVAIPENIDALELIEERFPGGMRQSILRKAKTSEILYYAYIIPPD